MTSNDANKEREMIREMAFIKQSRPFIEEVQSVRETMAKLRAEKYESGQGLTQLKQDIKELRE